MNTVKRLRVDTGVSGSSVRYKDEASNQWGNSGLFSNGVETADPSGGKKQLNVCLLPYT